jgi:hypothetical protein
MDRSTGSTTDDMLAPTRVRVDHSTGATTGVCVFYTVVGMMCVK